MKIVLKLLIVLILFLTSSCSTPTQLDTYVGDYKNARLWNGALEVPCTSPELNDMICFPKDSFLEILKRLRRCQ